MTGGMLSALLTVLVPSRCGGCGARSEPPWCVACAVVAKELAVVPGCVRCATGSGPAHGCWAPGAAVRRTIVAYHYTGPVAATVAAAKATGAWTLWPALGERLAAAVAASDESDVDVVTPVPVDARRLRRRGFDHTRLLADPVATSLALPLRLLLVARSGRADQARRGADRREVAAGAFQATRALDGARVLLVDDVVTTGATAARAAEALHRAGAGSVVVAALARAGERRLGAREPRRAAASRT